MRIGSSRQSSNTFPIFFLPFFFVSYLTGGVLRNIELQVSSDNALAWRECVKVLHPGDGGKKKKNAAAFCSCAVREGEDPSKQGLIAGHAYSILKLVQASDGKQLVKVPHILIH